MSGTLNKVLLIGNLGKDPESVSFEGGGMIVKFPIATSESYKNRDGQDVELTEWHNIVVRRKGLAEICQNYLRKGSKIYLEGRIRTRQWTDKEGQTRYTTEIQMDEMTMLTPREDGNRGGSGQYAGSGNPTPASNPAPGPGFQGGPSQEDDDLPF